MPVNTKGETRLGRGLEALLGDLEDDREAAPEREVSMALLRPNRFQPRADFDEAGLNALAESIRENGLLQPLVVRPAASGWEIVAGERRWRALRRLGWEKVPVIVREIADEQMLVLALVENLQREDLSPLEEAAGYRELVEEFGLTQQQVAERVGRDRSTVANTLRLLGLPETLRDLLAAGEITAGHARAILSLSGEASQLALAREITERGLSVRAAEARAREMKGDGRRGKAAAETREERDPFVDRAERALERALGTRVRVRPRSAGGGEIRIVFHDPDDFGRLLRLLGGEEAGELLDDG